jgi:hypothetical protein
VSEAQYSFTDLVIAFWMGAIFLYMLLIIMAGIQVMKNKPPNEPPTGTT